MTNDLTEDKILIIFFATSIIALLINIFYDKEIIDIIYLSVLVVYFFRFLLFEKK